MSSQRAAGGSVREGTRVVLREITASLHNSPPVQPLRRKSGNDGTASKIPEHEVKVRFAREFADVGSISYSAPESLSSASSFQSLNSTLSTKSSSGICADSSVPPSPRQGPLDASYANSNISGVEDLILGCAEIHLNSDDDRSCNNTFQEQDISQDQTFASAIDEPVADLTRDLLNTTEILEISSTARDSACQSPGNRSQEHEDRPIIGSIRVREPSPVPAASSDRRNSFIKLQELPVEPATVSPSRSPSRDLNSTRSLSNGSLVNGLDELPVPQCRTTGESSLNTTVCLSPSKEELDVSSREEEQGAPANHSEEVCALSVSLGPSTLNTTTTLDSSLALTDNVDDLSLPSVPTFSSLLNSTEFTKLGDSNAPIEDRDSAKSQLAGSPFPVNTCNAVAIVPPPQIVAQNSIEEIQEQVCGPAEEISGPEEFCGPEQRDESKVSEAPAARPKTPELPETSAENISKESSNILINSTELSPPKGDSLEVNVTPSAKEEAEASSKVDESPLSKEISEDLNRTNVISAITEQESKDIEEQSSEEKLDSTLTLQDVSLNSVTVPEVEQYTEFQPQRQSTSLATLNIEQPNFEELKCAAEEVANDIFKSTLENTEDRDPFVSATSELFQDPTSFDFLIRHGNSKTINRLRAESLYVKFDPLVGDTSMLPQGNTQILNEEQNGKDESLPVNIGTPKRNPAIAAIDRLLFYSPISTNMTQKTDEPQEKIANKEQSHEEPKNETPLITVVDMSKELELVRATVLQLEEELEKQKKEYEAQLEKQKVAYQEKITKLQAQMAQEVKSKSQMTVVVEEYEKSISRLLTERERDRTTFEQELAKVQEELQTTNVHLTNTEAAFNDVHQKYERLKGVVSAYKSNESVLKESIQENMETIKGLETRYDHLKNHAMAQLEKANFELEAIRKQHEDETVKLHALVRKAELKSNSLAELVEQKTKENKELTQILDEVIARVGHQNAE